MIHGTYMHDTWLVGGTYMHDTWLVQHGTYMHGTWLVQVEDCGTCMEIFYQGILLTFSKMTITRCYIDKYNFPPHYMERGLTEPRSQAWKLLWMGILF